MAVPQPFSTYLDINGFQYLTNCSYVRESDGTIELIDVKIINEEGEVCEFPYLKRIDEEIITDIEEEYE